MKINSSSRLNNSQGKLSTAGIHGAKVRCLLDICGQSGFFLFLLN